jgi:hypothetical protein
MNAATRQEATNMTRINVSPRSTAWGKRFASGAIGDLNAYVFAAVLIICSLAVGCSSDKPKPVTTNNEIPPTQPLTAAPLPAPVLEAQSKPAVKKVVHKKPSTVNYADKAYGVTFEYPRRYAIETGDAAMQLVSSNPIPMNFVSPGGVALAAVELPETNYVNTDFSSAYFNVSINKNVSSDQCGEFAVPQGKETMVDASKSQPATSTSSEPVKQDAAKSDSQSAAPVSSTEQNTAEVKNDPKSDVSPNAKLLIGDMELRATEAVSGEGTRQSDSKYFHVYQNGACYEFALNVTTDASDEGLVKHVDRDKVFGRLEQILSTVKINPVTPEVTAEAAPTSPAQ